MSTLSTQVPPGGTQIPEYSMQYCLKYLYLEYFLVVKGLGSPKFPCMSYTPPSVKHVPMLPEVDEGIWDRKTGTGLRIWVLGQHRQDIQHNTTNGGFTPTPLGSFPSARGKPVWTSGPYSLAILHFYYSSIQQWYNVIISQYIITYHTSHLIACSCSQLATDPHNLK